MKEKKSAGTGGISFVGLLQVAFIVLKLCNVIKWSWWWVLSPALLVGGITVLLLILGLLFVVFSD